MKVANLQSVASRRAGRMRLLASWLVVGVPLGWGVWQVLIKSLVLFGIGA